MLTTEIRKSFIDFFKGKGHTFVPSSPVVPIGDETLLFANAGMNQFKDVFLGTGARDYRRAANSQKCIRAGGKHNDLEDVGTDTYHHTFFEMLGNWSFGDYFKAEAIEWAWELLTEVWKMDPSRLHVTYFEGDKHDSLAADAEARDLWKRFLPDERIHKGNKKDNFWEMGETGPCGPCSEIHYDDTPDKSGGKFINKDRPEVIEIWNLVFIQFNRDSAGKLTPLPAKHVDTGMGLERVARFLQGKKSNYDIDLFITIIDAIAELTGKKYKGSQDDPADVAFRVIADHLRTLVFAITDGGIPSNEGRGYVLRRILRRAARFGRTLDMHEPFIYKLVDVVVDSMADAFGEIKERTELVTTVIEAEEKSFGKTLDRGLEIFATAAEKAADGTISGADAFQLYDTYGFPLDLTQLMAREKNLKVDTAGFDKLMDQQRERAKAAQKTHDFASLVTDTKLPHTDDETKYSNEKINAEVLGWISNDGFHTKGTVPNEEVALVLDKTCFYAASGGQTSDVGKITGPNGAFDVASADKIADCVIHKGKLEQGTINIGDKVEVTIDAARRESQKNHTATHLLQWALQQVAGSSVAQQGSLVCPEYLRFDFTSPKALTDEQIEKIENLVNDKISHAIPVTSTTLPIKEAKKLGAMALFGEKYGDTVRVIAVGAADKKSINEAFSKEFCGGTHVANTSDIGSFKIIKEEAIAAGIRRITALTGKGLADFYIQRSKIVEKLSWTLKVPADGICARVDKLIEDNKNLAKQLKNASKKSGTDCLSRARQLLDNCEKIGDSSIVTGTLDSAPVDEVRSAIDMIKKKASSAAVIFGIVDDDKVMLLAGVSDDLIARGLKAGDIVKEIAPIVDGKGGGKPQLAQAGGKNSKDLQKALQRGVEFIKQKLA